jgi:hypothetical protein
MALSDLQRAIAYGESELGEVAVLNVAANTYTINRARDGHNVLPQERRRAWSRRESRSFTRACSRSRRRRT